MAEDAREHGCQHVLSISHPDTQDRSYEDGSKAQEHLHIPHEGHEQLVCHRCPERYDRTEADDIDGNQEQAGGLGRMERRCLAAMRAWRWLARKNAADPSITGSTR